MRLSAVPLEVRGLGPLEAELADSCELPAVDSGAWIGSSAVAVCILNYGAAIVLAQELAS